MPFTEYPEYDAIGLAALVRKREVRPSELAEAAIERIEAFNPAVNAVVYKAYDHARALAAQQDASEPSGPLFGVPFLLKDILGDCEGWPTTLSSRASHFSSRPPAFCSGSVSATLASAGRARSLSTTG